MSKFLKLLLGLAVLAVFNTDLKAPKLEIPSSEFVKMAQVLAQSPEAAIKKYTDQAFYAGVDPKTGQIIPNEKDLSGQAGVSKKLYKTMSGYRSEIETRVIGLLNFRSPLIGLYDLLTNLNKGIIARFTSDPRRRGFTNSYVTRYFRDGRIGRIARLIDQAHDRLKSPQSGRIEDITDQVLNLIMARMVFQDLLFALWDCAAIQGRQERFLDKEETQIDYRTKHRQHFYGISIDKELIRAPLDANRKPITILNAYGNPVNKRLMDCGWISTIFFRFKVIGYSLPQDPLGMYLFMDDWQVGQFADSIQYFINLAMGEQQSLPAFQVPTETFSSTRSSDSFKYPTVPPLTKFGGPTGPRVSFDEPLSRFQSPRRSALKPSSPVDPNDPLLYSFLADGGPVSSSVSQSLLHRQEIPKSPSRQRPTSTFERAPTVGNIQRPPSPYPSNPFQPTLSSRPEGLFDSLKPGPFPKPSVRPSSGIRPPSFDGDTISTNSTIKSDDSLTAADFPVRFNPPQAPSSDSLPKPTFSPPPSSPRPVLKEKQKKEDTVDSASLPAKSSSPRRSSSSASTIPSEFTIFTSPISFGGTSSSSSSSSSQVPTIFSPSPFPASSGPSSGPSRPLSPRVIPSPSIPQPASSFPVVVPLLSTPVIPSASLSSGPSLPKPKPSSPRILPSLSPAPAPTSSSSSSSFPLPVLSSSSTPPPTSSGSSSSSAFAPKTSPKKRPLLAPLTLPSDSLERSSLLTGFEAATAHVSSDPIPAKAGDFWSSTSMFSTPPPPAQGPSKQSKGLLSGVTSYLPSMPNLSRFNPFGRSTSTPQYSRLPDGPPTPADIAAAEQKAFNAVKKSQEISDQLGRQLVPDPFVLFTSDPSSPEPSAPSRGSSGKSSDKSSSSSSDSDARARVIQARQDLRRAAQSKQPESAARERLLAATQAAGGSTSGQPPAPLRSSYGAALLSKSPGKMTGEEFGQVRQARRNVHDKKKKASDAARAKNVAAIGTTTAKLRAAQPPQPPASQGSSSGLSSWIPSFNFFSSSSSSTPP